MRIAPTLRRDELDEIATLDREACGEGGFAISPAPLGLAHKPAVSRREAGDVVAEIAG